MLISLNWQYLSIVKKNYKWHKIAETTEELHFGNNQLLQAEVAGKQVCIVKTSRGIAACAAKCPHAGGIMAEGFVDKSDHIICPIHRYTFNLDNGRDISGEGYYLKIYPLEVKDSGIFLGIEDGGLFNWLK
jgi:nitrite reductase/ring-hydroxylating ferredoxin subunit